MELQKTKTNIFIISTLLVLSAVVLHTTAHFTQLDQEFLDAHNEARFQHGLPPLTYDQSLADCAFKYASSHRHDCVLEHSGGPLGENLFLGPFDGVTQWNVRGAVQAWMDEKQYYDPQTNSCAAGQMCGHYTQIVWRDTKRVGCALTHCDDKSTYIVCNYSPPGNVVGYGPFEAHDPFIYGGLA